MAGWKFYTEINGVDGGTETTEFNGTLALIHRTDLSDNPQDSVLYYANIDDDPGDNQILEKVEANNPGVNQITLAIVDAAVGSGHEATEVTLGLLAGDLDTNTAGASLDIGTDDAAIGVIRLRSGVSAARPVHIRVENAVTTPGTSLELTLELVDTIDRDIST